jgi:hypothetical protein
MKTGKKMKTITFNVSEDDLDFFRRLTIVSDVPISHQLIWKKGLEASKKETLEWLEEKMKSSAESIKEAKK